MGWKLKCMVKNRFFICSASQPETTLLGYTCFHFSIKNYQLLEKWMLNSQPSKTVQLSVGLMLGGALVAALGDLSFNLVGYIVIFFNDLFTALNGVILKRTSEGE